MKLAVYLIFRFLTGFCSSAFLSVAGGTVSDLFDDAKVAMPMAVYTVSPFIAPALGPLISGYVCRFVSPLFFCVIVKFGCTGSSTRYVYSLSVIAWAYTSGVRTLLGDGHTAF